MKNIFKNPLFYLSIVLIIAVGFTVFNLVKADSFREPTSPFPQSDVNAPIDESDTNQTKKGFLTLSSGLCLSKSPSDPSMECRGFWDVVNDTAQSIYYVRNDCYNVREESTPCNAFCRDNNDLVIGGGCFVSGNRGTITASSPLHTSTGRDHWYCYAHQDCYNHNDCFESNDKVSFGVRAICLTVD